MTRDADRTAFTRACTYLNFKAAAKWTALVAAVAAGVLYVLLLLVLWLFGDEMVHYRKIMRRKVPDDVHVVLKEAEIYPNRIKIVNIAEPARIDDLLHLRHSWVVYEDMVDL